MNATFTPKQKYANATHQHTINSAPSSIMTKESSIPSPTLPPSYKSAAPLSTSDMGSCSDTSSPTKSKQTNQETALKRQKDVPNPPEETPQTSIVVRHQNPSSSKRKPSNIPNMASPSTSQRQKRAASRTTLIRRVQAVVHVKHEESDDDYVAEDDAFDDEEVVGANQRRHYRRSRKIVKDDEENYSASDGNPVCESGHLKHRSTVVSYQEDDEDEDEDELTMGAEV